MRHALTTLLWALGGHYLDVNGYTRVVSGELGWWERAELAPGPVAPRALCARSQAAPWCWVQPREGCWMREQDTLRLEQGCPTRDQFLAPGWAAWDESPLTARL